MTEAEERSAARAEVELLAQTSLAPTLDAPEIEQALDAARAAKVWEATTAYSYGEKVVPASPGGRLYRCVEAGTSGASEPTFPDSDTGRVTDGGVTWEEAGPFTSFYDVRKAVQRCLALKVAKDELVDASGDGRSLKLSQRAERNERLMMRYQPLDIS